MSNLVSPEQLAQWLGQKFPPTPQQAEVIASPAEPLLVVAGAGAGKTETMAARVVWLVANKLATPEQVLGLTFTRKAASQLAQRIRLRLATLAQAPQLRDIDPDGELARRLQHAAPSVMTYDAYAGSLVREYGLLLPVDSGARMITAAETYTVVRDVVANYPGNLNAGDDKGFESVVKQVLELAVELDNHLVTLDDVKDETMAFLRECESFEPAKGKSLPKYLSEFIAPQRRRLLLLPVVAQVREELARRGLMTFSEQMSQAARLVQTHPEVVEQERRKFSVVMLDEYQDTSNSQRVLLSGLFGGTEREPMAITAVGDPMQAIYGWRGATASNLLQFRTDFPSRRAAGLVDAPSAAAADTDTNTDAGTATKTEFGLAAKKELTISWRNPAEVLELANKVADAELGSNRVVAPLQPRPGADPAEVEIVRCLDETAEREYIANSLAQRFHNRDPQQPFTAAVLVRANKDMAPLALELSRLGVPVEIVGTAGLLNVPEIQDLVALARMLVTPEDDAASLRILLGPMVNLGLADLQALRKRANELASAIDKKAKEIAAAQAPAQEEPAQAQDGQDLDDSHDLHDPQDPQDPNDPLVKLRRQLQEAIYSVPETTVGLADAIADLGSRNAYSAEGAARLEQLAAQLLQLRQNSLAGSLTELFADIESTFGIRVETWVRPNTIGSTHLDKFAGVVAGYEALEGASLRGFLDYLTLAQEQENGLDAGEVVVRGDRVQLMTVHKAKGLEWQHVVVAHADDKKYVGRSVKIWPKNATIIPSSLRSDADAAQFGVPVLDTSDADTPTLLNKAVKAYYEDVRGTIRGEANRLFYVAVTRAESSLLITSTAGNSFDSLMTLMETFPDTVVDYNLPDPDDETAADADNGEAPSKPQPQPITGVFPKDFLGERTLGIEKFDKALRSVEALRSEENRADTLHSGETSDEALGFALDEQLESEVDALLDELQQQADDTVEPIDPVEVTASDLVAMAKNPIHFAKRRRRPVPFKPNQYAKRGTALHQWIEQFFGHAGAQGPALIDEDQLPGSGEEQLGQELLEQLKAKFEASEWANRTPAYVEYPFEVRKDNHIVRGRIDAIFKDANGWTVVDWKTGTPPTGKNLEDALIQLDVYRYAWAKLQGINPEEIRAGFYYIAHDRFIEFEG